MLFKILVVSIFTTLPFCVAQNFAFSEQIIPIGISMCLTAMAFLLTLRNSNRLEIILSILFLTIAIGSYQAFICVYFTSITAYCLNNFIFNEKSFKILKNGIIVLCISVILYMLIDELFSKFYMKTNYLLNNYYGYNSKDQFKLFFLSLANIIRVNFGINIYSEVIYGGFAIRIIYVLFIIILFYKYKDTDKKTIFKLLIYYTLFFISPYILYIMLLTYKTQGRMLLSLSVALSAQLVILYKLFKKNIHKKVLIFVCFIFLIYNTILNNLSFKNACKVYNDDIKNIKIFKEYFETNNIDTKNKQLIVIGKMENKINSKYKNVTIGASFFEWDDGNINRIRQLFSLNGVDFLMPTSEDLETAIELSKDMTNWENSESIIDYQNMIIIKLNSPSEKWYRNNLDILKN